MTFLGVKTYLIASGDQGAARTLSIMKQVVNESLRDRLVVETAKGVVRDCWGKDEVCQIKSIREWVLEHSRFCRDPRGVELLHTPRYMLNGIAQKYYMQFDCDDMAILCAALGKAVGLQARWVVLGFDEKNAPFTHVFTQLLSKNGWLSLDLKDQYERSPVNVSRKSFYMV